MNIIAKIGHTEFLLPNIETAHQLLTILGKAPQVEKRWFNTAGFTGHVITEARRADSVEFSLETCERIDAATLKTLVEVERREDAARRAKDKAEGAQE